MRKNIIYVVIFGILAFSVWFFLFKDTNIFGVNEAGFKIKDTGAIEKVFLADRRGQTISVSRSANGWVMNDGQPANQGMINQLFQTLWEQEAAYPVPEGAHNGIIKSLSATATKVELYNKKGDAIAIFYVGGQTQNGTYMLMEGAKRPYVVHIPAFQGYIAPRYTISRAEWRDRDVVRLQAKDVMKVEVKYPNEELNNFTLTRNKDGQLEVAIHPELSAGKTLNTNRAEMYTGFFENANCEGYLNGVIDLDTIIATAPKRCEVYVEGTNGFKQHIDVYWMEVTKRSKNLLTADPNVPDEYDADRYYAVINNYKDTVIIQRHTFNRIFQKGYVFYEEDTE